MDYLLIAIVGIALGVSATWLVARRRNELRRFSLQYFLYVSDTKVDMLFDQMGEPLRTRLSQELKLKPKMLEYTIKHSPNPTSTRWARLRAVLKQLEDQGDIGTMGDASPYFYGRMEMKQGTYAAWSDDVYDTVLFTGIADNGVTVALGGTAQNIVGYIGEKPNSNSGLVGVLRGLKKASEVERQLKEGEADSWIKADAWGSEVREVWEKAAGPTQLLEFVAVKLKDGSQHDWHRAVLGSPLYVSIGNDEPD